MRDPSNYRWMTKTLPEMTREELIEALMMAIDQQADMRDMFARQDAMHAQFAVVRCGFRQF